MRAWIRERLPRSRREALAMTGELIGVVVGLLAAFFGRHLIYHWFGLS